MNRLRTRLILSHLLPLLIVVPLAALALTYILETQVLLVQLSESLQQQAILVAEAAQDRPDVWTQRVTAQIYVTDMAGTVQARIMLLQPSGYVLAASHPEDQGYVGQQLQTPGLLDAQEGQPSVHTQFGLEANKEVADVLIPVTNEQAQVVGIVRATNQLANVSEQFWRLRQAVLWTVVGELLLGALVGLVLALRLEKPLRAATITVDAIAAGDMDAAAATTQPLLEKGPEEIRHLLKAVNHLAARLTYLEEARRRLLANVVHELGRPLGALRAAVHALRTGAAEQEELREELLLGMDTELGTLQALLDDLAQLHSQVLDPASLSRQRLPLGDWLNRLLPPWREAAQARGLEWETDVDEALPAVPIDPDRLAQAVGNLLSNAIKYTPPGGEVAVSAGANGDRVWIAVTDSAPAIPEAEQARIFEPFYRGRQAERFPQGLGLGLTIARDLVAAHGGELTLRSEAGVGNRFTIYLPKQDGG